MNDSGLLALTLSRLFRVSSHSRTSAAAEFLGSPRSLDRAARGVASLTPTQLAALLDGLLVPDDTGGQVLLRSSPLGLDLKFANLAARAALRDQRMHKNKRQSNAIVKNCPQIIGIGALNFDHIVIDSSGSSFSKDHKFEEEVQESEIDNALSFAKDDGQTVHHSLGGSAFNVIRILLSPTLQLRTGFVGVSGALPTAMKNATVKTHREFLDQANCDVTFVQSSSQVGGRCSSLISEVNNFSSKVAERPVDRVGGFRYLKTWQGANSQLLELLIERFEDLSDYLASSDLVHVTSIFDNRAAQVLAFLLARAVQLRPDVEISFDPGDRWADQRLASIRDILGLSTLVLVNMNEFEAMVKNYTGSQTGTLEEKGKRLLAKMRAESPDTLLVVKDGYKAHSFGNRGGEFSSAVAVLPELPEDQVVEDTGAGDTFAAGLLAARVSRSLQSDVGTLLGLHLAQHKLQKVGPLSEAEFSFQTGEFLCRPTSTCRGPT